MTIEKTAVPAEGAEKVPQSPFMVAATDYESAKRAAHDVQR